MKRRDVKDGDKIKFKESGAYENYEGIVEGAEKNSFIIRGEMSTLVCPGNNPFGKVEGYKYELDGVMYQCNDSISPIVKFLNKALFVILYTLFWPLFQIDRRISKMSRN